MVLRTPIAAAATQPFLTSHSRVTDGSHRTSDLVISRVQFDQCLRGSPCARRPRRAAPARAWPAAGQALRGPCQQASSEVQTAPLDLAAC